MNSEKKAKGLFVVNTSLLQQKSGIGNKIYSQVNALQKNNVDCQLYQQKSGRENVWKL